MSRKSTGVLICVLLPIIATGCLRPVTGVFPPGKGQAQHRVYVVDHGWHTGLVVSTKDLTADASPASRELASTPLVEMGWGDEGFYRAQSITLGLVTRAVFWPTPTVLHVVGVDREVEEYFPASGITAVDLSDEGLRRLCAFLSSSYDRDGANRPMDLGPGIYGDSRFFRATGKYYFPNTCNKWTARALRSAGCPISPFYAVRAGNVFRQTARFGVVMRNSP
ncbi:MAG: DUF2459 domain-containing protein [Verrucomicrobia bacterium]|nr:DUF2459 domain-containing protein [Verrucomicrobiota bacterium]